MQRALCHITLEGLGMNNDEVLKLPMRENDADAATVGEYLSNLLCRLIENTESFNSKRPFGNSGWYGDLKFALVKGRAVSGEIGGDAEDEYVTSCDVSECDYVMTKAVKSVFLK
jgi:hypothetical protein